MNYWAFIFIASLYFIIGIMFNYVQLMSPLIQEIRITIIIGM